VLHAKVDWLVCREVCIPGKAELEVSRVISSAPGAPAFVAADEELFKRFAGNLPKPLPASDKVVFSAYCGWIPAGIDRAAGDGGAVLSFRAEYSQQSCAADGHADCGWAVVLDLKKDPNLAATLRSWGVLELSGGRNYEIAAVPGRCPAAAPTTAVADVFKAAGLAFLGGIILNLMPCVFPVLFIKGLSLVQSSRRREAQAARAWAGLYGWDCCFVLGAGGCAAWACVRRDRRWAGDSSFSRRCSWR
jgi:hypothetical protein